MDNFAWVALLSSESYFQGIQCLSRSLTICKSKYPLAVMVTPDIPYNLLAKLEKMDCILIAIDPLDPSHGKKNSFASNKFHLAWSKLRVWSLTQFNRVVFLDTDMLVLKNMDELFQIDTTLLCAVPTCICNPTRQPKYPHWWTKENCSYSYYSSKNNKKAFYFNAGLLVLSPSVKIFNKMLTDLNEIDFTLLPMADQDFLNTFFGEKEQPYESKWKRLPFIYNAVKTLMISHQDVWDLEKIKNLHYIIAKPWDDPDCLDPEFGELNKLWREVYRSVANGFGE